MQLYSCFMKTCGLYVLEMRIDGAFKDGVADLFDTRKEHNYELRIFGS